MPSSDLVAVSSVSSHSCSLTAMVEVIEIAEDRDVEDESWGMNNLE